jgi:hypothetical protein
MHGFITIPGGNALDLNSLIVPGSGYTILAGLQINDQGQIVALAQGPGGVDNYLYLTPNVPLSLVLGDSSYLPSNPPSDSNPPSNVVPEPASVFFMLAVAAYTLVKRPASRLRG